MRKSFIDNLRWICILILIPYHAAQAWNTWGEPNYIFFEGNRLISSIIVFFSPYYMPLLFLLAGVSTKYALSKRTYGQYIIERIKRLLIPLLFGTLLFMPLMTWLADRFHHDYEGTLLQHYAIFFTKYTDFTGADGGFSFGQFWFLLYLFVISILAVGIIALYKKFGFQERSNIPFWLIILLGLPLPLFDQLLSIGGKSLVTFTYIFMVGYFVFSKDKVIENADRYAWLTTVIGVIASAANVYLFIWSDERYELLNAIINYIAKWFMLPALIGLGKKLLDRNGKIPRYMSVRSFPFFSFHFIFVVLFQYLASEPLKGRTALLYILPVVSAYICTFICAEICIRVPVLCFLTGTKHYRKAKNE